MPSLGCPSLRVKELVQAPPPLTSLLTHFQLTSYQGFLYTSTSSLPSHTAFCWVKNLHHVVCLAKELWLWCTYGRASLPRRQAKEADLTPYACTQHSHQQALWLLTTTWHQHSLCKCYTPSSLLSHAEDASNAEKEVGCLAFCCGHGKVQSCLLGWVSVQTAVTAISAAAGYGSCGGQAPPREFFQHTDTHTPADFSRRCGQTWAWPINPRSTEAQDCHQFWHGPWISGSSNTSGVNAEHHRLETSLSPVTGTVKEDYQAHFSSFFAQGEGKFCCLIRTQVWNP